MFEYAHVLSLAYIEWLTGRTVKNVDVVKQALSFDVG
jgi:hypothetical protein